MRAGVRSPLTRQTSVPGADQDVRGRGWSQELGFLVLVLPGRALWEKGPRVEMPPLVSASRERGLLRLPRSTGNPWAGRAAAVMSPSTQGLGVPCSAAGNQTFTKLTPFFSVGRAVAVSRCWLCSPPHPWMGDEADLPREGTLQCSLN